MPKIKTIQALEPDARCLCEICMDAIADVLVGVTEESGEQYTMKICMFCKPEAIK